MRIWPPSRAVFLRGFYSSNDAAWRRRLEALDKRDEEIHRKAEERVRAENMVRDIQNNLRNKRYDIIEKHYKE